MLTDAINFSRPGLSANFNDGSGITLSSSSSLSINAGYVGMFAGNVSITGTTKLVAEKGGSFLSLENEFYNDAGIVMENGSDRAANEPFDDDPQSGAAEAAASAIAAAMQAAASAIAAAVQGAIGKIGDCLAGGAQPCYAAERENCVDNNKGNSNTELNIDLRNTLNKPWANVGMDGTHIKSGYDVYKEKTYNYCKTSKPDATDREISGYIVNQSPLEYKFKALWDHISNYNPLTQFGLYQNQMYVNSAVNNGFDLENSQIYGELYGDFSANMLFETGFTITASGIKAASALMSGKLFSEEQIVAGSGVGNISKPTQLHHFATNKSKKYTKQFEDITKKYNLELDYTWNKESMPHQGRHPDAYHEYVLREMTKYDNIARGNKETFLKLYGQLKNKVINNPDMLTKDYWK